MRSEDYDKEYFEDGTKSNYVSYGDDPGWIPTASVLARLLEPKSSMLEVGCAKGYFVKAALIFGINCIGIDISQYAIANAVTGVKNRVFVQNIAEAHYKNLDSVVSWEMLEHVPEDEVNTVLLNLHAASKAGGLQVHRICLDMASNYAHQDKDHTHVTVKPRQWWEERFENLGWIRQDPIVEELDALFADRDWSGRFFVYRT